MKTYKKIALYVAGAGVFLTALAGGLKNSNNRELETPNLKSVSRSGSLFMPSDKVEYTKLKDGSEEVLIRDRDKILRYQNFDGDNTVDRIRTDEYILRDIFVLENILIRSQDYSQNSLEFDAADSVLLDARGM